MNEVKTSHGWHLNTSIWFDTDGVWLRVSLNIPPQLASHLSPNNVQKGKYRIVYHLQSHIQSDMVNKYSMENIQNMLLKNCMNNIRNAKLKAGIQ